MRRPPRFPARADIFPPPGGRKAAPRWGGPSAKRPPGRGPVPDPSLAGRRGIPREPAGKFHNGNDLFSRGKVRQLVGPAAGKENRRNLLPSGPRHTERGEGGGEQLP